MRLMLVKPLALALVLLASCQSRNMTSGDAIAVTNEWWTHQFSGAPDNRLIIKTSDLGDKWRVTYSPPPDAAGGYTTLLVDKRTRNVVHMEGTQ
jgi:hypothetical protein